MRRAEKRRSGRPAKFAEPRRPITVTLPERTIESLAAIHPDRAHAIVKATDAALSSAAKGGAHIELLEFTPGLSVIIIPGPCQVLRKVKGLRLVEVAPARFLLSIPSGAPIDYLELALADLLEDSGRVKPQEQATLKQLKELITNIRRRALFSTGEMLFVDTKRKTQRDLDAGRSASEPPPKPQRRSPQTSPLSAPALRRQRNEF